MGTFGNAFGEWSGKIRYNAYAESFFSRMSIPPSSSFKSIVNRLLTKLDSAGILDKADIYRIIASTDTQSASLNIVSTNFYSTAMGTVNFTPLLGYTGNGTDFFIKENYNPGTDFINYQKDDSTIHYYVSSDILTDAKYLGGIIDGTNWSGITVRSTGFNLRLNNDSSSYNPIYSPLNSIQFAQTVTRDNSSYIKYSTGNGVYITSTTRSTPINTVASSAVPNKATGFYSYAINNNGSTVGYSTNILSFVYIGGGLTELQSQILANSEKEYLDFFEKSREIIYVNVYVEKDGTGDYLDITSALSGITDATFYKRYNINFADTFYEQNLTLKNFVNLIGQDILTSKIIGYLPPETEQGVIQTTSTINCFAINFEIKNCYVSIQNGRYAIHSDDGAPDLRYSQGFIQNIENCLIEHLGNVEADTYHGVEVWETTEAMGVGLSWNMKLNISDSELISYGTNLNNSNGLGLHSNSASTYKSIITITNSILRSIYGSYSLKLNFLFNNNDSYYFNNVSLFNGIYRLGDGTYTDNTTLYGTNPIILNGTVICD